jgi:hypothetical protein
MLFDDRHREEFRRGLKHRRQRPGNTPVCPRPERVLEQIGLQSDHSFIDGRAMYLHGHGGWQSIGNLRGLNGTRLSHSVARKVPRERWTDRHQNHGSKAESSYMITISDNAVSRRKADGGSEFSPWHCSTIRLEVWSMDQQRLHAALETKPQKKRRGAGRRLS